MRKGKKMSLERYKRYDRRDLRNLFEPQNREKTHLGRWQQSGIISIPDTIDDYAFLVTFGTKQGDYTFKESIDEKGILTWQSQSKNSLNTAFIQKLINHDEQISTIYFFLRTEKTGGYIYVGDLAYVSHDPTREKPVHFKWQILNFDREALEKVFPDLQIVASGSSRSKRRKRNQLSETLPPETIKKRGMTHLGFNFGNRDFIQEAKRNEDLGEAGERAALKIEIEKLKQSGRNDLLKNVYLTRDTLRNTAPYDLHSCNEDGEEMFIEVKTTTENINTPFYISAKEILQSVKYSKQYCLYRIYDFDMETHSGKYYVLRGDLTELLDLEPIQFIARSVGDRVPLRQEYWEKFKQKVDM